MQVKDFGDLDTFPTSEERLERSLEDLAQGLSRRRGRFGAESISTGSLYLDHATGFGGLPRGQMVSLRGASEDNELLAFSVIAETQKRGGVVAVFASDSRMLDRLAEAPEIDHRHVWLAASEDAAQALSVATEVVERQAADVVVVDSFTESSASRQARLRTEIALQRLAVAVHGSRTCFVMLERTRGGFRDRPQMGGSQQDLQLTTRSLALRDARSEPSGRRLGVEVFGGPSLQRRATVEVDATGSVSRMGDLLDLAAAEDLVQRRGSTYRYGSITLGRGRAKAKETLVEIPDLTLQIESMLERVVDAARQRSARWPIGSSSLISQADLPEPTRDDPTQGGTTTGLEQSGQQAADRTQDPQNDQERSFEPRRYLNAWFEGDDPVLPLVVGEKYRFIVQIGARRLSVVVPAAVFIEPDWGGKAYLDLLVSCHSSDFHVDPHQRPFRLPRIGESEPQVFTAIPQRRGPCVLRIVVSLANELEVLQRLQVQVDAVTEPPAEIA